MSLQQVQLPDGARLLEGKRNWWFLGRGGVVRLGGRHVTPDGACGPTRSAGCASAACSPPRRPAPTR